MTPIKTSNQLQPLEARVAVLADDDVVVHGDAERAGDVDDRLRHLYVGVRWRRIARRMVVQQTTVRSSTLFFLEFLAEPSPTGDVDWGR